MSPVRTLGGDGIDYVYRFCRTFGLAIGAALVAVAVGLILTSQGASAHGGETYRVLPANVQVDGSCESSGLFTASAEGACTHGPDPAPPGVTPGDVDPPVQFTEASFAVCAGNGSSGDRVQVLYVHAADKPDRYDEYLTSFRQWASEGDGVYQASAKETGGMRYIRFVHDANCIIDVENVQVSSAGDDDFWTLSGELWNLGFHNPARKYLVFLDRNHPDFCGQADVYHDDSSGQGNTNNTTYGFAVIYNGCWSSDVTISHELGHNFGAVQGSSPNASRWDHCVDEWDVMCYDDGSGIPLRFECSDYAENERLDCNKDDYFNTQPKAGSYLATHWNIANSAWLGSSDAGLSFNRDKAKYNDWVAATMSGFTPGRTITLYWPDLTVMGTATASGSGTATFQFRAPLVALGNYTLLAKDSAGMSATGLVRIIPRLNLSESSGYPGAPVRVYLYGYGPNDVVRIEWIADDGVTAMDIGTVTVADNGRASVVVAIPYSVEVGSHWIRGAVVDVGRSSSLSYELLQTPWRVSLSKTSSKYNGQLGATLTGFAANSPITLTWQDGNVLGEGTTDGTGAATFSFLTPLAPLGDYVVLGTDGAGSVGVASLHVVPRILLSEDAGYPLATIRVYYYGFAPGDQVETRWYDASDTTYSVLSTLTIADNGRGSALVQIPESKEYGAHTIRGSAIGASRSTSTEFSLAVPPWNLSLSKSSSKYNGSVVATMTGFAANQTITLTWPGGTVLAAGQTDGAGNAALTFRTPLAPLGNYAVRATDGSGDTITATLRVIPRIKLSDTSGAAGSTTRVYFYGFALGDEVEIRWYVATSGDVYVVLDTVTIADNGRGSVVVTTPDDAPFGKHTIRGSVIGVSRSASTTYTITNPTGSDDATPTPSPAVTATATPEPSGTPIAIETPTPIGQPTETAIPDATSTPEATATETETPVEIPTEAPPDTATPVPTDTPSPSPTDEIGRVLPVWRQQA